MIFSDLLDALTRDGYAASSLEPTQSQSKFLSGLSEALSSPIFSDWHSLKPAVKIASSPVSYSGLYGLGPFPMHTDLANWEVPPQYVVLCASVGSAEVSTPLIDGTDVVHIAGQLTLDRALVNPRRPVKGRLPLMRLYNRRQGVRGLLRWDPVFLRAYSNAGHEGFRSMTEAITKAKKTDIYLENSGDLLVIDNWRMLHCRSDVTESSRARHIQRAHLGNAR